MLCNPLHQCETTRLLAIKKIIIFKCLKNLLFMCVRNYLGEESYINP